MYFYLDYANLLKNWTEYILSTQCIYILISDLCSLNCFSIFLMLLFIYHKKLNYPILTLKFICILILFAISLWNSIAIFLIQAELMEVGMINEQNFKNSEKIFEILGDMQIHYIPEFISLFFGFYYFRLILELKNIQRFGLFIGTIEAILRKVVTFFILYGILLFTFAEMGTLIFSMQTFSEEFKSLDRSIVTLIGYTFGGFAVLNYYDKLYYSDQRTYIELITFCFCFLFLFNIFLINLLIALISAIYSKNQENGSELYLLELNKETNLLKYSKKFSSFTSSIPLIIQYSFPLYLGYFFIPHEKINFLILKFQYFFIWIFNFILLLIFNIIMVPISYFMGIFKFFSTMILNQKRSWESLMGYMFFLLFGIIFLAISSIINIMYTMYIFANPNFGCREINHVTIIPSKKSFKKFNQEMLNCIINKKANYLMLMNGLCDDLKLSNNKTSGQILQSMRKSNVYSKIDLIFICSVFDTCEIEENVIEFHHMLTIFKSQKGYFKYLKSCSKQFSNEKCNQWKNFIISTRKKVLSKSIMSILNKS